ncbi:RabGAP/TBC [Ascodesmis nigricans]|uniref:RabGAP/TBC n=1 Tax=Ascodesmis nigricans TaxID=341454 RepID=A0A4S2MYR1_9PEZI|nr:RabGAP/TBC [Ascodesmis nigricans]
MLRTPANPRLLREKEDLRARKWRQMAIRRTKPDGTPETGKGGGAEWDFPVKDPKLIRRTWKGIPDCWRGAAWHAFLTASSKARGIGQSDNTLASVYHELLTLPCSDDVQIDLDVPRTISSHVLFRRRYRGGQRLLFRVLHSLALYFPHIGYVQGMASLAATLLCYYDEGTAFIMLVRLWQLRGLEQLYEAGFGGLMTALDEFETKWMKNTVIQKKLKFLNINATAYGTRWYLTLFNYSIPFAAQLRIWDVFMLLGDPTPTSTSPAFLSLRSTTSLSSSRRNSASATSNRLYNPTRPSTMHTTNINHVNMHDPPPPPTTANNDTTTVQFNGTLDVLHATSAAILDGMKTIILKADFEEAMKNLTSFVPVRDEDMLMRVVKAEWKARRRRW